MENAIRWSLGFIVGAAWSVANFYFTVNIFKISVLKKDATKLTALVLLKFPVLYLAGFLILISKAFPVAGLLTGLTAALITMGIVKLCTKQA
ncbi:MAG: hypothetical protein PHX20_02885 [Candidatus Omnitrophica bacterium]|nr:hypothetical protein [Candidatus Omnitrophota bacterium]MDD5436468.1 hypothetical protein [Candidatus Omnitrophota bacterium]